MDKKDVERMLRVQYLHFCKSPLRSHKQILEEYEELKAHPRVTNLGFLKPHILMVGTDKIIINSNGIKYLIGEFIIFLIRKENKGYFEVDFRFQNVTNPVTDLGGVDGYSPVYMHPHIVAGESGELGCANGPLCISKGQFGIYQHLRKGEIYQATDQLIRILEIYPTGKAYHEVWYWPQLKEGSNA